MANPVGGMGSWMSGVTAATGINSVWIKKALDAGVITPDMQPDAIYKAVSEMATGARPQLPAISDAAGQSVRDLVTNPTAMIPFDNGARGFQMGANTTTTPAIAPSPGTGLIPAPPRRLPGPQPRRLPGPQPRRLPGPQQPLDAARAPQRQLGEAMTDAALVGAVVAGGGALTDLFGPQPALTSTSGTAELANQSRPVPEVPASTDPREQAQALIAKLNQMRRSAGGEVKEAPQMMADVNRLLAMSDKSRNASPPGGAYDYHMQAQSIIAKLNAMRQQAGGEVPQAAQMMAEVRRLQAMGDQRRNAMQTR